ncbi:bifunctional 4-hydroxy-2-oxoglutarate aldolase/2-dehydro-3-deoxy-phosphogluconate aldolase [Actinomadura chibensis]|uniref:Bifunctional 4-hydroxy-2-oxoglutarate aldolase/2-dehydro-3-deoxy-phosphogluconate aldolase n=1 Tax=Actinomadura chibensis TaxID=392828 RepID=A0A5D0NXF8_9ACTN|nr:bifunctional 4-hydroxy-2-oxoglutarate aldolase/2-dehydro-3-deoxy-phosphogluconate aldolase [Actinomadura chibensis]TYB49353.1 bifunctional 4-hydroxy-2-oxoglutarate aldolase/2-dehydro-3-deoxy-phosphogluconate aldolase [Actinomadura chibensis]
MTPRLAPGGALTATGVVAVVRGTDPTRVTGVLDTLVAAGIRCLEITLNTPGALDALRAARDRYPDDVELGAGTVRTPADASAAVDAGASFLVAPDTDAEVAVKAHDLGVPYYPGALTPSEVARAWDLGATAVKVFPAHLFGPEYLRDLAEPFRDIALLPTGGVRPGNAGDYVRAGAIGVGVGGSLIGDALDGGSLTAMADRAYRVLNGVRTARLQATAPPPPEAPSR